MEKLKRYIIFIIGLYINSFGVSLITKAALGTSPISSIPYVLSLNFPFTLGQFTIFFSILLIVLQLFILGKNFKLEHALQIPVSIAFGYFIDFSMFLLADLMPQAYVWKMIYLLLGCLILGIGVYAEVLADVVMLPGESFVRAIVFRWNTDFGITKICFDVLWRSLRWHCHLCLQASSTACGREPLLRPSWWALLHGSSEESCHFYRKNCFLQRRSPTLCRKRALLAADFAS